MHAAQSLSTLATILAADAKSTSPVWHYWIAVPIALGAIAAVITVVALYLKNVTSTRYPKGQG
jgi:formate-dependent nitrite reductase membrane component NrfD